MKSVINSCEQSTDWRAKWEAP